MHNLCLIAAIQGECHKQYDVVVLLDRSIQLKKKKAKRFVELLKDILHKFDIREGADHFGLLLFGKKVEVCAEQGLVLFNLYHEIFVCSCWK